MILKIHSRKMKLSEEVDFDELSSLTDGANGSDLKAIAMEAGMFAVREERFGVGMEDFRNAIRKLLITPTKHNLHSEGMFA